MKQTTWFTKGLRRFGVCSIALILNARNKRPDLRRDCDSVYLFIPCVIIQQETNDLIYEGIATLLSRLYLSGMALSWNKRPDLRRDCDRLLLSSWTITGSPCETNDLIYEGIATVSLIFCCCCFNISSKQTTWFTKGLRRKSPLDTLRNVHLKQTTWFTKGLRQSWALQGLLLLGLETNDLSGSAKRKTRVLSEHNRKQETLPCR